MPAMAGEYLSSPGAMLATGDDTKMRPAPANVANVACSGKLDERGKWAGGRTPNNQRGGGRGGHPEGCL